MLATLVAILCNGQLCLLQVCLGQLHFQTRRLMLVISKPIMLSKEYLEAARTLFRVSMISTRVILAEPEAGQAFQSIQTVTATTDNSLQSHEGYERKPGRAP
jgi:hypothetical protein